MTKHLLAMQETWVRSLGQEDSPEEGTAAHSSILAGRIPWTEEPDGLVYGVAESDTTERLTLHITHTQRHTPGLGWVSQYAPATFMYISPNSIKKPLVGDRQGALGKLRPGHLSGEHQKSAASLRAASVLHFNNILDLGVRNPIG